jgi:MFS family permease
MPVSRRLPSSLRALAHVDYRRWAAAGTLSVTGTWMQVATQAWLLLQLSDSGAVLGAGVALNAVPGLVLGPWGGVLADRFSRRRILLFTQTVFALLAATQAVAAMTGSLTVTTLLVFSFLAGLVGVIDGPAAGALGTTLVPPEDLPNAAALGSATNSLGRIVGMSVAGVLIAVAGPGLAFCVNAVSFLPVLAVLVRLRTRTFPASAATQRPWVALKAGLRFVIGRRDLCWLLALTFVLGALGRSYQVTMGLMVDDVLGGGAAAYAACSTAFAVGALGGAAVAAHLRRVTGRVVVTAAAVGAVGQVIAGAAPTLPIFLALIVGIAAAAVVLDTAASTCVATSSPDALRGRVLAVAAAASAGAGAVGGPALGALGEAFGARAALLVGGLVCITAVAFARRGVSPAGRPAHEVAVPVRPHRRPRPSAGSVTSRRRRPALSAPTPAA